MFSSYVYTVGRDAVQRRPGPSGARPRRQANAASFRRPAGVCVRVLAGPVGNVLVPPGPRLRGRACLPACPLRGWHGWHLTAADGRVRQVAASIYEGAGMITPIAYFQCAAMNDCNTLSQEQ